MGMTVPAVLRYELVRFFRRRATFWATTWSALIFFAALAFGGAILFRFIQIGLGVGDLYHHGILESLAMMERVRYILLVIEFALLVVLAYLMAHRSIANEIEGRSFTLLLQTPLPVGRIMLGKMLGLALALLVLHSILMTVLALPTPFMRRPPSAAVLEFFFVWLVAASYLPEGAAGALAKVNGGRTYVLFRLASLSRIAALFLLLEAAIPHALRQGGVHVWGVLVSYWSSTIALISGEHLGLSTIGPGRMAAIVVGWQIISGLLLWVFFVRGRIR